MNNTCSDEASSEMDVRLKAFIEARQKQDNVYTKQMSTNKYNWNVEDTVVKPIKIGFWRGKYSDFDYPMPVVNSARSNQNELINRIQRLEATLTPEYQLGFSPCRICDCRNGSGEYMSGGFLWPDGYLHYLKEHNVKCDPQFEKYIFSLENK